MDDTQPPARSHIRMARPANDDAQPQPYRPSLLRQPDDPGIEEDAQNAGARFVVGLMFALGLGLCAAVLTVWIVQAMAR